MGEKQKSNTRISQFLTKWCINQDGIVKLSRGLGNVDSLHLLKAAQRVAFRHQLRDRPLVQCARDQEDDIINHVAVPAINKSTTQFYSWLKIIPTLLPNIKGEIFFLLFSKKLGNVLGQITKKVLPFYIESLLFVFFFFFYSSAPINI